MWAMFIMAIPCIGQVAILIWAFSGDNESRKNHFRAVIYWFLIILALYLVLGLLGARPAIQEFINDRMSLD